MRKELISRLTLTVFLVGIVVSPISISAGLVIVPTESDSTPSGFILVTYDCPDGVSPSNSGLVIVPGGTYEALGCTAIITAGDGDDTLEIGGGDGEDRLGADDPISDVSPSTDTENGLVPQGRDGEYNPDGYGSCEFVETVNNVIQFLIQLTGVFAVIVFLYAGFVMVSSRGDAAVISQAKTLFGNVLIGFVILITAFLVINTILGILVGGAKGGFTWQKIECTYAEKSTSAADISIELSLTEYINEGGWVSPGGSYGGGGGRKAAGGSCAVRSTGDCSVEKLIPYFGDRAEEASQICSKESGGAPVESRSDICCGSNNPADCRNASSFSGGYFQINILAHAKALGCDKFFESNGSRTEGNCIMRTPPRPGIPKGICIGWSCKITDTSAYEACMAKAMNRNTNFETAGKLFKQNGFLPWANSAKLCSIPY